jgi:hypothetical protein
LVAKDNRELQAAVDKLLKQRGPEQKQRKRKQDEDITDDGRTVIVVEPIPNDTSNRRSTRVRAQVHHEYY